MDFLEHGRESIRDEAKVKDFPAQLYGESKIASPGEE
jgi:hypothetical protein